MSRHDQEWAHAAACRGLDTEAWVLPDYSSGLTDENRLAIRICRDCPVIKACARYALRVWPVGMIHAATPIRRNHGLVRSATSENALHAIIGDAA